MNGNYIRKCCLALCAVALALTAGAEEIAVTSFRHAGPYPVRKPFMVDSLDVRSKPFGADALLETPLSKEALKGAEFIPGDALPGYDGGEALHWAAFSLQNSLYAEAELKVSGPQGYRLYVDGEEVKGKVKLTPAIHEVSIKYLSKPGTDESLGVTVCVDAIFDGRITLPQGGKHLYGMKDVLLGTRFSGVELSPDGKYMMVSCTTTLEGGKTEQSSRLVETATGKTLYRLSGRAGWMPSSNRYYWTRETPDGTSLLATDPATGEEEILAEGIPQGRFQIAPGENALIYTMRQEGPAERKEIYQILTPDDRQPGWRSRSYLSLYDLRTGVMQPLTFGHHSSYLCDISRDGGKVLFEVSKERLTRRPTTVTDLYLLDIETLEAEKLIADDGFMGAAQFSPDGESILLEGSPEAFGGIGANVAPGQTPSMIDRQLYIMDLASRKIRPMTRDFDPCVQSAEWNKADGMIYFTAENIDLISLYRLNPRNGRIDLLQTSEELVSRFSVASDAPVLAYYGQSASNSDRLYTLDLKSRKSTLVEDLSAEILADVELGECRAWTFKNAQGETVHARYYLPPQFDASRKYPMIVNYYGGCSPTERNFESRYPHHAYAALGYVVLVIATPSGATGCGQQWSARHVNTAGEGPAQDILTGAQTFCREHSFVNEEKVGCIGASYGGFMSQYLPTITDFFACSVSHAGISDHTSYWGFGYWGYSYSETSMAGSYPWTRKDLYVDQSPLYRADRINTPLLFVHGDSDTNVPFNESVQMFTALKLLGKETAFVAVEGQDHHILDYQKRLLWQDTIWAWFAKWLQDDSSWWDAIYTPKSL